LGSWSGEVEKPRCSVGIPTRDRPEKMRLCLEALASGSFKDFQVIVADSSGDERTEKICEQYSDKLTINYIRHGMIGGSAARNVIANFCEDDVLIYVDDDVYVTQNCLTTLLSCYRKIKNNTECLIAGAVAFPPPQGLSQPGKLNAWGLGYPVPDNAADYVYSALVLLPKAVYKKIEWNERILRSDDQFYCLRCKRNGIKLSYCRNALAIHDKQIQPRSSLMSGETSRHYVMLYKHVVVEPCFSSFLLLETYGFIRRMLWYLQPCFYHEKSKIVKQSLTFVVIWLRGLIRFLRDLSFLVTDVYGRPYKRTGVYV
jgi:glycosyltransferase involved in cell wall biosynthesis